MKKILIAILILSGYAVSAQSPSDVNMKVETRDAFYPGGQETFDNYIFKHLTYTEEAKSAKSEAEVMVSFYVNSDSSITDIKVMNDPGYGVGEKLKELLKTMKFAPALANGTPIRSKMIMYVPVRAH